MQHSKIIALMLSASLLTACTEPNGAPGRGIENGGALSKEDVGVGVGVVSGGLIGSAFGGGAGQVAAILGGALLGGILGDTVGKSLDNKDRAAYDRASQHAMDSGTTHSWSHGHNHGSVTPQKEFTNDAGDTCRAYTQTIYIGSQKHTGHGTACKQADGTWQIVG